MPTSLVERRPVEKLLSLLGKTRWESRDAWRGVATALKNVYGDAYKDAWKRMSKLSPKYEEAEADKLWETVSRAGMLVRP